MEGKVEGRKVGGATDSEAATGGGEDNVDSKKDDERASLGGGRRATPSRAICKDGNTLFF